MNVGYHRAMTVGRGMVIAVVAAQFCVPLVALVVGDRPTRLGFQMYSGLSELDITVEDGRGQELDVDLFDHVVATPREEIDWTQRLPQALCEEPRAARVTVTQRDASRTVEC